MLPESRLWTKDFVIISVINFLTALAFYLLMVVISQFAMTQFQTSPGVAGLSASIFVIGGLIARLLSGKWIARIGHKRTLVAGAVFCLVMTLAYFLVNSVGLLLAVRFFHGMGFGVTTTATATIVATIIPRGRSGESIGYYSLSTTIATAVGPFLAMFVGKHGSFQLIFAVCAAVSVVSLVMPMFLTFHRLPGTEEAPADAGGLKGSTIIESRVIPISVISLLVYVCYSSVVSFLAVYAREIQLVDAAGFFFIVYAIVILVSRPFVGRVFDMRGENSIMYLGILVFAIALTVFSQARHGSTLLLAAGLIGLGFGAVQSSSQAISVKVTPRHRLGLASSTYFMFSDIGMGLGPLVAGIAIPYVHYRGMYLGMAILGAACLALYYSLHGRWASAGKVEAGSPTGL